MADTTTTPATTAAATRSTGTISTTSSNASGTAGKTTIDDTVVSKVAGIAAREVNGVHSLGGGAARAIGALRDAIGQRDHGQGVKVEVGEKQVAADITIVAEYPVSLQQVADGG
ncbi:Asp23/Gls24 family envelope stress response protein, partial [Curtobacterium sp. ER1/6]|uniref:Asp23/Gls24 family envelope stress response protein n=1 Tax=Curtobacterium sp. ER1/6 TaxID=1891920 RepID=UPI00084F9800